MRVPASSKHSREILLVYGHHALLERWWSLAENLRWYGPVTVPDLPGFGGMQSFSKIGTKPDIDAYADYLASFIKLRYKQRRITIVGVSFGFVVATRMLQKYPQLAKKVDLVVSLAGFMCADDFRWPKRTRFTYRLISRFFATRPVSFLIRYVGLNRFVIETLTHILPHSKHRYIEVSPEEFKKTMDFEVKLWHANDVRTHWLTTAEFFRLDNTKKHIDLPVAHVTTRGEQYFNNIKVEQHMRMVFKDYEQFASKTGAHVPHTTADKKTTGAMLPPGLRKVLSNNP